MEKRFNGFKSGICPNCGEKGEFTFRNYEWDGNELHHYFICPKCGAACCDYYTVEYSNTDGIIDFDID